MFLYLHQEAWQQRIVHIYGNNLFLMDATYKTMNHSAPLFFIAIKTNVGYAVVADFVIQNESSQYIQEALNILMQWNPQWKPKYVMVDNDQSEITDIKNSFRDIITYICDFHREQAWVRWLHKGQSGVSSEESKAVLGLIRAIAISLTEKEMNDNISKLKTNEIFLRNKKLQLWMKNEWLSMKERWVRFYRHRTYDAIINTNNGLRDKIKL